MPKEPVRVHMVTIESLSAAISSLSCFCSSIWPWRFLVLPSGSFYALYHATAIEATVPFKEAQGAALRFLPGLYPLLGDNGLLNPPDLFMYWRASICLSLLTPKFVSFPGTFVFLVLLNPANPITCAISHVSSSMPSGRTRSSFMTTSLDPSSSKGSGLMALGGGRGTLEGPRCAAPGREPVGGPRSLRPRSLEPPRPLSPRPRSPPCSSLRNGERER